LLTVSSERGIVPRRSATVTMFKAESYKGYKLCWPGDLVINSLWAWARGLGVSRYHGIISSAYGVYRLRSELQNNSKYFHELVRSTPFQWELQVRSKGVWISRLQLTDDSFLNAPFPIPPPDEQTAIVRYLNYMDKRIHHYISAKKKLIMLLNEQKQAVIQQAVTRGLDPNVRLKPSGVGWLGDIPEYWQSEKLARLTTGIGDGLHGTPVYVDESTYYFINGNNLTNGSINFKASTRCVSEYEFKKHKTTLDNSTLLMSINGTIGSMAYYRGESIILGKSAAYINCGKNLTRRYLFFQLQSATIRDFFQMRITGTTIFNLSLETIRNLVVALPPIIEQEAIVDYIETKTSPINNAINHTEREIELLQEYRTCLVSDVVTGKLDVREAAANLLDEIEDEVVEDEAEWEAGSVSADEEDETAPADETDDK
jgi:type I restriction enzyme S subunit